MLSVKSVDSIKGATYLDWDLNFQNRMKTPLDPRHKKRQKIVEDLFKAAFHKQRVGKDSEEILKNLDIIDKKIQEAACFSRLCRNCRWISRHDIHNLFSCPKLDSLADAA